MKKWFVAILVVLLAAGGGVYYWRQNSLRQSSAAMKQSLPTVRVKRETIESSLTGTASIVYSDRRVIQSTVSGTMAKVLVEDGALVKKGDLLAIIDNQTILDELEQARMDLENLILKLEGYKTVTAAQRASAETKMRQAEEILENRRADVQKLTVSSPVEGRVINVSVRQGQSISAGQVLLSISEDTAVMVVAQVSQGDISRIAVGQRASVGFGSELPGAVGEVTSIGVQAVQGTKSATVPVNIKIANPNGIYRAGLVANVVFPITGRNGEDQSVSAPATVAPLSTYDVKSEVAGVVQTIAVNPGDTVKSGQTLVQLKNDALVRSVAYAENDLIVAREAYDRIQQGYAPNVTDTDLKQLEFQIKQAETKVRVKSDAVAALQIRSPIDGVVLSHTLDETASVTAGNTLFVLADPSKMHMVVPVDELDVMQVRVGQKASITVDAMPGKTFSGTVTKIASEGTVKDGIATYDVTVTVDLPKDLKGSMTGTATIVIARKENVLTVPPEAIKTDGNRKYVNVFRNGVSTPVYITTGMTSRKAVEVVSGLQEGDIVVLSSSSQRQNQGPGMIPGIPGMGGPPGRAR